MLQITALASIKMSVHIKYDYDIVILVEWF